MTDFSSRADTITAQATDWVAVTPSNSTDLPATVKAIRAQTAGDVALVGRSGTVMTITVAAGEVIAWCSPRRINSTGTTATVWALY